MLINLNKQRSLDFLLLGLGMMGSITPGVLRQAGMDVVGILGYDLNEVGAYVTGGRASVPSAKFGGTVTDFQDALQKYGDMFDAVNIALPNFLHADTAIKAIQAGKHVLIEKPLATNAADARRVLEAAVEMGVAAEVNSQYMHHELFNVLGSAIERGEINNGRKKVSLGEPIKAVLGYIQDWQKLCFKLGIFPDIGWRPEVAKAGKGKLTGDLGSHVISTLIRMFGGGEFIEFNGTRYNVFPVRYKLRSGVQVQTFGNTGVPGPDKKPELWDRMDMDDVKYSADDRAMATFKFRRPNGKTIDGEFRLSQVDSGKKWDLQTRNANNFYVYLQFEGGAIEYRLEEPNHLIVVDNKGREKFRYERASSPSTAGTPAGHPHGYTTAILLEVLDFQAAALNTNVEVRRAYTRANLERATRAVEMTERWNSTPIVRDEGGRASAFVADKPYKMILN